MVQILKYAFSLPKRRWNRAEVAVVIFPVIWAILFIVPTILAMVL